MIASETASINTTAICDSDVTSSAIKQQLVKVLAAAENKCNKKVTVSNGYSVTVQRTKVKIT